MIKSILIVVGVLLILGLGGFIYLGQTSKNGAAPGLVDGNLAPCPETPNCVSSEMGTPVGKKVDPLPVHSWGAIPAVIRDMGGKVTSEDESYFAAEFTSATFGFVDDLELRKSEDGVQVRSASRVGYSDAGVNAARIAELRIRLEEITLPSDHTS